MKGSSQPHRLEAGGRIDRSRPIRFRFAGRIYEGFAGDTLASALLANDVTPLGRSFKYHRPRGLLGAGAEEPNVLVQLGEGARSTPNVRATEVELYEGLVARPVNCWPSATFDVGGLNNLLSRFLSAGFYYKTFMWPSWRLYESAIRRAAGLGRVALEADPDRYEGRHAHCDVLVVGAGPSGLAAARAAAGSGARVILVEQDDRLGGSLLHDEALIDGAQGRAWAASVGRDLRAGPQVQVLTRTCADGYFDHNALSLLERVSDEPACAAGSALPRFRRWHVRAARVILATGAHERPLVFAGNDLPGVMLSSAVRTYLGRYGVRPGEHAVILTNNDDAYATAFRLADAGASVRVVDARPAAPDHLAAGLALRDIPMLVGPGAVRAEGGRRLRAVTVTGRDGGLQRFACDLLAVSGGFNPATQLFCQSGGDLRFDPAVAAFVPDRSVQAEQSVGAAAGVFGLAEALRSGHAAGLAALAGLGRTSAAQAPVAMDERATASIAPVWCFGGDGAKAFVDFQNDVTVADIRQAARENFASVEHLKRYTTLGMAPDQGKTSGVNALAILGALTGRTPGETGVTRARFPFTPAPLGSFRGAAHGELFRPMRRMPAHARHLKLGALMEDYGGWLRPAAYVRAGETRAQAEAREALAVRSTAGLFEGSPLGKIEVVGPDAGVFLDRVYANTMSSLKPGHIRYGLMLNEMGVVIDDGVTARLGAERFLVCTSSAGATKVAVWMDEWLQCEWPDLRVVAAPVTTAWAVLTLTGPAARAILLAAGTDIDVSLEAFPHLSLRQGRVAGFPARVLRVSYTGEVSFEINVAASQGPGLWERLMNAGGPLGLQPVGIDAWMLLRTEKGYLHVGADTDGATTPLDVGFTQAARKTADFIGKRSLFLPEHQRADRPQFVGFEAVDGDQPLLIGAHVVEGPCAGGAGYVTSAGYSPVLGRGVALGMLRGGRARIGELVTLKFGAIARRARVTAPAAYDPQGGRLHG